MKKKFYLLLILAGLALQSESQVTCAGETVRFQETFGSGGNAAALPAGRTNYNYNSGSSLTDGDYKLYKNSQGRPEWFGSSDHTGNNNGRMMVINASFAAGEFYKDTVENLNAGSYYSVYLYVMNVNTLGTCGSGAILPKLQFVVETLVSGSWTELTSFTSAFIPQTSTATWVKIAGGFQLPNNVTSVRYRILNASSGGCGNDLALDDITFSQCAQLLSLPVKGLNLNVVSQGSTAVVNFSTISEYNTQSFEVEKSTDGSNWSVFATLAAAGYSDQPRNYQAPDGTVIAAITYYRVRQVDADGKYTYSPIASYRVNDNNAPKSSVYPNPFAEKVSVMFTSSAEQVVTVRVVDGSGRPVQSLNWNLKKGPNVLQLDNVQQLPRGFYLVEARDKSGNRLLSEKMMKN